MRKIRFRAYYKPENRMIYDIQNEFEERIELGMNCFADYLNNNDFVVEQDTGVKDKNGETIWEGDIVRIIGYGTYEVFQRSWDSSFSLRAINTNIEEYKYKALILCKDWEDDYIIIGNIHQNPELLEETKVIG